MGVLGGFPLTSAISKYDVGYIYAKVEVEIRDNEIVSITILEHRNEWGEPVEKIIDDVVEK